MPLENGQQGGRGDRIVRIDIRGREAGEEFCHLDDSGKLRLELVMPDRSRDATAALAGNAKTSARGAGEVAVKVSTSQPELAQDVLYVEVSSRKPHKGEQVIRDTRDAAVKAKEIVKGLLYTLSDQAVNKALERKAELRSRSAALLAELSADPNAWWCTMRGCTCKNEQCRQMRCVLERVRAHAAPHLVRAEAELRRRCSDLLSGAPWVPERGVVEHDVELRLLCTNQLLHIKDPDELVWAVVWDGCERNGDCRKMQLILQGIHHHTIQGIDHWSKKGRKEEDNAACQDDIECQCDEGCICDEGVCRCEDEGGCVCNRCAVCSLHRAMCKGSAPLRSCGLPVSTPPPTGSPSSHAPRNAHSHR